jgi:hypothetical protein
MLKATTSLDTDVSDAICEMAIDERNVTQRLRKTIRNKLASLDLEDEDMWEPFLAMQWDLFVDVGSKGVNIGGFIRFLHSIQIYLSHNSVERIFGIVDFDQDGIVRWIDITTIVFPEMAKLRRDDYALSYNARLGYTYDIEYEYSADEEDEEFYLMQEDIHNKDGHVETDAIAEKPAKTHMSVQQKVGVEALNEPFARGEETKETALMESDMAAGSQKTISAENSPVKMAAKKRVSMAESAPEEHHHAMRPPRGPHGMAHKRASVVDAAGKASTGEAGGTRQGTVARRASTITGSKAQGEFRPAVKRSSVAGRSRTASGDGASRARTRTASGDARNAKASASEGAEAVEGRAHVMKKRGSHMGESFAKLLHDKQEHIEDYYQDSLQAALEAEENRSVSSSSSSDNEEERAERAPARRKKSIAATMMDTVLGGAKRRSSSADSTLAKQKSQEGLKDAADNV